MLTSLSLIFLVGLVMGAICQKLKLPRIIGMLLTGDPQVGASGSSSDYSANDTDLVSFI